MGEGNLFSGWIFATEPELGWGRNPVPTQYLQNPIVPHACPDIFNRKFQEAIKWTEMQNTKH